MSFLKAWAALSELVPEPSTADELLFVNGRHHRQLLGVKAFDQQFLQEHGQTWKAFRAALPFAAEYLVGVRRHRKALRRLIDAVYEEDRRNR